MSNTEVNTVAHVVDAPRGPERWRHNHSPPSRGSISTSLAHQPLCCCYRPASSTGIHLSIPTPPPLPLSLVVLALVNLTGPSPIVRAACWLQQLASEVTRTHERGQNGEREYTGVTQRNCVTSRSNMLHSPSQHLHISLWSTISKRKFGYVKPSQKGSILTGKKYMKKNINYANQ